MKTLPVKVDALTFSLLTNFLLCFYLLFLASCIAKIMMHLFFLTDIQPWKYCYSYGHFKNKLLRNNSY